MSARNRGARADKRENYPTPLPLVQALCSLLPDADRVLEPSAGLGLFARGLLAHYDDVIVNDPYDWRDLDALPVTRLRKRMSRLTRDDVAGVSVIAGNPPFSLFLRHVRHGLHLLDDGGVVAYVGSCGVLNPLRMSKAGVSDTDMVPLPNYEITFRQRPAYAKAAGRSGGADSVEHSMWVWIRGYAPAVSWRRARLSWRATGRGAFALDEAHMQAIYAELWGPSAVWRGAPEPTSSTGLRAPDK